MVLASGPVIKITVNILQVAVRKGEKASIEAHWRILGVHTGKDEVGGGVFSAPLGQDNYASVAQALSGCLAQLADRLVAQIPDVE